MRHSFHFEDVILIRKGGIFIGHFNQAEIYVYLSMTIEIQAPVTKEKVKEAIDRLSKHTCKKSLKVHFGKLKRNMDGLDYQNKVRDVWP
jgi:hypothetical protein